MKDAAEVINCLEDVADDLAQAVERLRQIEDAVPGPVGKRLRQVRAAIEVALDDDHGWMGSSDYTLAKAIDEVRGIAYEEAHR